MLQLERGLVFPDQSAQSPVFFEFGAVKTSVSRKRERQKSTL